MTQPALTLPPPIYPSTQHDRTNVRQFRPVRTGFRPRILEKDATGTTRRFGPVEITHETVGDLDTTRVHVGALQLQFSQWAKLITVYAGHHGVRVERDYDPTRTGGITLAELRFWYLTRGDVRSPAEAKAQAEIFREWGVSSMRELRGKLAKVEVLETALRIDRSYRKTPLPEDT